MASSFSSSLVFAVLTLSIGVMVESRQVKKVVVKPAADGEDIEKVCTASLDKEVCLNCINADHSRETNEKRDLTHSLMFCTWSQASFTQVYADQVFQNTTDAKLKEIYEFCDTKLNAAQNQFFVSMTSFEKYDYNKSRILMCEARKQLDVCAYKIEKDDPRGIQISQQLLDDMSRLNRLWNVARIVMSFFVEQPSAPPPVVAA